MVRLDQPANALWLETPAPSAAVAGGETRHFDTVMNAISFIMEDLPADVRGSAWITTDDGSLTIEEIEQLWESQTD
jgi:6,7-dimethyl-8-ribityllumazine synthase